MKTWWFAIAAVMLAFGLLHVAGVFYSSQASITAAIWMVGGIVVLCIKAPSETK